MRWWARNQGGERLIMRGLLRLCNAVAERHQVPAGNYRQRWQQPGPGEPLREHPSSQNRAERQHTRDLMALVDAIWQRAEPIGGQLRQDRHGENLRDQVIAGGRTGG